jgi:hypothetical protein
MELSNVYNWGRDFRTYTDRWKKKFPNYIDDNGNWNKICIRCNKNLQDIPRILPNGGGCNWHFFSIKWGHCKECGDKYEKIKNKYRNKAYNLLKIKTEDNVCEITGCNKRQLKYHFELLFDSKMNWDNQNSYWQIDHRIPVSWFDLYDKDELLFCCNYKNLQPMENQLNADKSCYYPKNNLFTYDTHSSHTFSK